jgi:hypothetical protein
MHPRGQSGADVRSARNNLLSDRPLASPRKNTIGDSRLQWSKHKRLSKHPLARDEWRLSGAIRSLELGDAISPVEVARVRAEARFLRNDAKGVTDFIQHCIRGKRRRSEMQQTPRSPPRSHTLVALAQHVWEGHPCGTLALDLAKACANSEAGKM